MSTSAGPNQDDDSVPQQHASGVVQPRAVELGEHGRLALKLREVLERFEPGAPPPIGARDLLIELAGALAESTPAEARLSPRSWVEACEIGAAGVESLQNERPDVQGRKAENALRELAKIFERPAPQRHRGTLPERVTAPPSDAEPELPRVVVAALLTATVAGLMIAIFVDKLAFGEIVGGVLLLLWGSELIVTGLTQSPMEHLRKPRRGRGRTFRWIAHRLPLRLARTWWVMWGLIFLAAAGYGLWRKWPHGRYHYPANLNSYFMDRCEASQGLPPCQCILRHAEASVPFTTFQAFDRQFLSNEQDYPDWILSAVNACQK